MMLKIDFLSFVILTILYEMGCTRQILSETGVSKNRTEVISGAGEQYVENQNHEVYQSSSTKNGSAYPFLVAVGVKNGKRNYSVDYRSTVCSGSIIDVIRVISSCSCFHGNDYPPQMIRHPREYFVTAGISPEQEEVDILNVVNIYYHPMCDMNEAYESWVANVAVLRVEMPGFVFSPAVQPIKYPDFKNIEWSSDELKRMSDSRMKCLVLGWSPDTPVMQKQIAELVPLDECINPSCDPLLICPLRTVVDGFMIRIPHNSTKIASGAPLLCNDTVWAVTNTKKLCPSDAFSISSTFELLYGIRNFQSNILNAVNLEFSEVNSAQFSALATSFHYRMHCAVCILSSILLICITLF